MYTTKNQHKKLVIVIYGVHDPVLLCVKYVIISEKYWIFSKLDIM